MTLSRFDKVAGVRTRPTLEPGDIVLIHKDYYVPGCHRRDRWVVTDYMIRTTKQMDCLTSSDGQMRFIVRNLRNRFRIEAPRRTLWKTGARLNENFSGTAQSFEEVIPARFLRIQAE